MRLELSGPQFEKPFVRYHAARWWIQVCARMWCELSGAQFELELSQFHTRFDFGSCCWHRRYRISGFVR